jgi:hypothetical protein
VGAGRPIRRLARPPQHRIGVDHDHRRRPDTGLWEGTFTGPTLGITDPHAPARYAPFHPLTIPADGHRQVSFVFHANPRACRNPDDARNPGLTEQDAVTIHFSMLGLFDGTQTVPLGTAGVAIASPTKAACA